MNNETRNENRDNRNGQYNHGLERVCARCGQTKGIHEAEAPYALDDATQGNPCVGFKAAKKTATK